MANSKEADQHTALKQALPPVRPQNAGFQSSLDELIRLKDHKSIEHPNTTVGFGSKQVGLSFIHNYSAARSYHSRQGLFFGSNLQQCRLT